MPKLRSIPSCGLGEVDHTGLAAGDHFVLLVEETDQPFRTAYPYATFNGTKVHLKSKLKYKQLILVDHGAGLFTQSPGFFVHTCGAWPFSPPSGLGFQLLLNQISHWALVLVKTKVDRKQLITLITS